MPEAFEEVWRDWGDRRMTANVPFESLLEEVFQIAGRRPAADLVSRVVAERCERQARLLLEPDPRVVAMLGECRDLGCRIAVVSNAAVEDLAEWQRSPFAALVDATVFSWEVGVVKPHPRIYQVALASLSADAAEAAFVSDAPADLDGAARAGFAGLLQATWFRHQDGLGRYPIVDTPANLPRRLCTVG